jgi:hypothetical protein
LAALAVWYGGQRYQARIAHLAAKQAAATSWPTVPGVVVASGVDHYEQGATDSEYTVYAAAVTYRFVVGGVEHTGNAITPGERDDPDNRLDSEDRAEAEARAGRYPVGAAVVVHYDPQDPATQSCLEV